MPRGSVQPSCAGREHGSSPTRQTQLEISLRRALGATPDVLRRWEHMSDAERAPYRDRERTELDRMHREVAAFLSVQS